METQGGLFDGPAPARRPPRGAVHLGTSSWSAPGWVGPFYPLGTRPKAFLAHYAREFTAVEVDSTYYRVPTLSAVEGWRERTPPEFRMCAKFPREVVHGGEGRTPDPRAVLEGDTARRVTERFLGVLSTLGERRGPLLLQFPWFSRDAFQCLEAFLPRLDAFLGRVQGGGRIAVEVRNQEWLRPPLLELLRGHDAGLALADLPRMEHPDTAPQGLDLRTSDFLYVRLIGDRWETERLTSSFDEVVVDRSERIVRWAEWLAPASARATETFAFANNHFAGHGPASARALGQALEERGVLPLRPA